MNTPGDGPPPNFDEAEREALAAIAALDRRLSGRLPCVVCRYDLQGLSVLGVCPECGSLVRATILAAVDPLAEELKPIDRPVVVAVGLVLWSVGGLLAAVFGWTAWALLLLHGGRAQPVEPGLWAVLTTAVAGLLALAGLGAVGLRRPHAGLGWRAKLVAVLGAAAYGPLAYVSSRVLEFARVQAVTDATDLWSPAPERTLWRLAGAGLALWIIVALRPNVRLLVARSLVIRSGRVDRQTMLAMAAVVLLGVGADVLGVVGRLSGGPVGDVLRMIGTVVMVSAAALLTLGLAGAVADCVRIAWAVLTPARSLRSVLAPEGPERPTRGGGQ